ncbi:MAG: Fic family protein [Pseudomonadota bacterium]
MQPPLSPPLLDKILATHAVEQLSAALIQGPLVKGRYLHWDEIRHRTPPENVASHEAWWFGIKHARQAISKPLPFRDKYGKPFVIGMPDPVFQALHRIDRDASGHVAMDVPAVSEEDRDRYLVSSLIEEALTSSQLEGAATTREVAKAMLRSGRKPRDRSERMVLNNYKVMRYLGEVRDEPLTPELVLEMHRMVTAETLDDPSAAGRFRTTDETVHVMDAQHSTVLHTPPGASSLPQRLQTLCDFANQGVDAKPFVHPVVRAILIHLMLGYDHPFVDGNGRTARALFYWSMAHQGYWLAEYLSISRLLRKAPARYAYAYLYTETDGNDATYFVIHQLKVIEQAIDALHEYLVRKSRQQRSTEKLLRHSTALSGRLNHRQVALLSHALKHPGHGYSIESHRRSHNISYQTARTDLLTLADLNLLEKDKRGRAFSFFAPDDLQMRLQKAVTA